MTAYGFQTLRGTRTYFWCKWGSSPCHVARAYTVEYESTFVLARMDDNRKGGMDVYVGAPRHCYTGFLRGRLAHGMHMHVTPHRWCTSAEIHMQV